MEHDVSDIMSGCPVRALCITCAYLLFIGQALYQAFVWSGPAISYASALLQQSSAVWTVQNVPAELEEGSVLYIVRSDHKYVLQTAPVSAPEPPVAKRLWPRYEASSVDEDITGSVAAGPHQVPRAPSLLAGAIFQQGLPSSVHTVPHHRMLHSSFTRVCKLWSFTCAILIPLAVLYKQRLPCQRLALILVQIGTSKG